MRTTQTELKYGVRAVQLINQAGLSVFNDQPSVTEVINWLINSQSKVSRSTWRQYRAALICYYETQALKNTVNSEEISNSLNLLRNADYEHCLRRGINTSSKKKKKISESDQTKLVAYFTDNPNVRHGVTTLVWLLSGIWTGLRPAEWQYAQLVQNADSDIELHVINAKNTNGRSHGDQRIVHLSNMSLNELEILGLHIKNIESAKDKGIAFDNFYQNCRHCLYKANLKLWPKCTKFISLYSSRHQFSADAKKSGLNREAIAALMGHASVETAGEHYGRRTSGSKGFRVAADQSDIARVEQLNAHRVNTRDCDAGPRL